jgi:hypothetical protein
MTDERAPIDPLTDTLLPRSLRTELCIASVMISGDHELLRFRLDPGSAFQRRGYVRSTDGTRFLVGISERYLPDGPRAEVCGSTGIPAADVPDQLRTASGWAHTWDRERDHWYDARPRLTPAWKGSRRDIGRRSAELAAETAAERAWQYNITHYLHAEPGRFWYGSNPPGPQTAFYSVTLHGDWSLHQDRRTYPLANAPDATSFAGLAGHVGAGPARLAREDRTGRVPGEAAVLPFRGRPATPGQPAASSRRHP